MTEDQARNHHENPFDITKTWSQKKFPLIDVGMLELNKNQENYFADVEQACIHAGECGAGYRLLAGPLVAGPLVFLWRYASLPAWHQSASDSGERAGQSETRALSS